MALSLFLLFITNIVLDVNECAESTHNCNENSTCRNTEGSYLCPCNSGFDGDGFSACLGIPHAQPVVIFALLLTFLVLQIWTNV